MAETIEAFVDKLQADGVEAGREAAEKIRAEAEQHRQQLIHEAQARAKEIVEEADAESQRIRAKAETELELAARDTVIRLQETLNRALQGVLAATAGEVLRDAEFLRELLRDIVMQYVRADIEGTGLITINVSEEMRRELVPWAIQALHQDIAGSGTVVDLHGALAGAGFEYKVTDGTFEVTAESVVESISDLVGPAVRDLVARAVNNGNRARGDG